MIEATHEGSNHPTDTHVDEEHRAPRSSLGLGAICAILAIGAVALGSLYRAESTLAAALNAKLAQADSEAGKIRADLERANAASTDLQRQLEASRVQLADLKSQLGRAADQRHALQAQLDNARAELGSLQKADKARDAGDQARLSQAADEVSGLRRQLDQAKSQSADLQTRLAAAESEVAKLQPLAARARTMPVAAAFERAFFGGRYTLHLRNQNPGPLKVTVTVDGSENPPTRSAVIPAGAALDMDSLREGQNVVVTSDGFDPVDLTVK